MPAECYSFGPVWLSSVIPSLYKFGEFELDSARYELRRNGRRLKLERIPMDLLILLIEKDGCVVTRQEIIERLWGKDVFVDTEHGINTAIRKIRLVLKDDPEQPRFIQTVTGKGYRFVGDRNNGEPVAKERSPELAAAATSGPASAVQANPRRWWPIALAAGGLIAIAAGMLTFNTGGLRWRLFPSSQPQIHSIAVLPLANLSGDSQQDYFADGMTDELITMLAKNTSLRVVSRTSAMQYKGVQKPVGEIARELGVDGVLEGSVEKSGPRVHMTVQLIHAPSDTHIWAESYDRDFNDALSLPSELSQTIAKEIRAAVSSNRTQPEINAEAHDAYLQGRYFWFQNNLDRSLEYFQKAIQLQPNYTAAWCGICDAFVVKAVDGQSPAKDVMPKAAEACHKAAELDVSLAEVHSTLAGLYLFGDWDPKRADAEALRALALEPNRAETHHLRAYILLALNRGQESIQEQKRAMELDPFARPWALGKVLMQQRQFDAAINEFRLRAEAQPQDPTIHYMLYQAYRFKGRWNESVQELKKTSVLTGQSKHAKEEQQAFDKGGPTAVAEWNLNFLKNRARIGYISPVELAGVSAEANRKEETLKLLEEAYAEHSPWLILIQGEPDFDFLHSDPRYRALIKKIGLAEMN